MKKYLMLLALSCFCQLVYPQWKQINRPDGSRPNSIIGVGHSVFIANYNGIYMLNIIDTSWS